MKRIHIIIVSLLILPFITFAQLDRSVRPKAAPAPEIQIGEYQTFVLENGLKVFLVQNDKLPRISLSFIFDYDAFVEGNICGASDITGQLLKTATNTRKKADIDEEIDFIGASLSTSATSVYASSLSKHKEKLFEIVSDIIINAKFSQDELDKIKKQMISGLAASKNSPEAISERLQKQLVYGKSHPYGESPTEETINNIKLEDCEKFFKTYIRPNITYLAIVGDINSEETQRLINKYFAAWKKKDVPKHLYETPKAPKHNIVSVVDRPNSVQSTIAITFPVELKPGTEDAMKARLMNSILGGGTSRLFDNLREKHGFTYGAYSSLTSDKLIGAFEASSDVRTSVTDSAITEILFELNRIINEPVDEIEMNLHRNEIMGGFALSLESPQTVASFALSIERYNLDKNFYKNYLKNLEKLTVENIQEAARKFLKPQNAHIVVVGKADDIVEVLKKFNPEGVVDFYDEDGNKYDPSKKTRPAPEGLTAENVIEKYLTAIGGRKTLSKTKDITKKYATLMQGMLIEMIVYQKAPNKLLVEVGAGGMKLSRQVFDGQRAVSEVPMMGQKEELEGEALEKMKLQAILNIELDYAKHGVKLNLLGVEDIDNTEAFKVEFINPDGSKSIDFYDTKTYLKIRSLDDSGISNYSDYQTIKKIKYPGKVSQDMQGQTIDFELKTVEVNKKLDDKLFSVE